MSLNLPTSITTKQSHSWQVTLAERIRDELRQNGLDDQRLRRLVQAAFDDLSESIRRAGLEAPGLDEAIAGVYTALDAFMVHKVNSAPQIRPLLNPRG